MTLVYLNIILKTKIIFIKICLKSTLVSVSLGFVFLQLFFLILDVHFYNGHCKAENARFH